MDGWTDDRFMPIEVRTHDERIISHFLADPIPDEAMPGA
jgi:hypothetical protein